MNSDLGYNGDIKSSSFQGACMDTVAYELTRIARDFKIPALIGFNPTVRKYQYRETPSSFYYPIYMQGGRRISEITGHIGDIERNLNSAFGRTDLRLVMQTAPPPMIELLRPTPEPVELTEADLGKLRGGVTLVGKHFSLAETSLMGIDLANPDTAHVLIAGMTGSGKSVALKTVLLGLMSSTSPTDLKIFAIDMKNRGLRFLSGFPHLEGEISVEPEDVTSTVKRVAGIVKSRKSSGGSSPIVVLAVDEISEFAVQGLGDLLQKELLTIGRQGRELRVHLVVTVHRPDAYTLGSDFLQQFGVKVVGRLRNSRESKFVLGADDDSAAKLPGRGAMIFAKTGGSPYRVQVLLPTTRVEEVVKRRWPQPIRGEESPSLFVSLSERHINRQVEPVSEHVSVREEREREMIELSAPDLVEEVPRVNPDLEALRPVVERYVTFGPDGTYTVSRGGWSRMAEALGSYPGGSTTNRTVAVLKILEEEAKSGSSISAV
jgi:energy-coupling factor transporter ATP-binding protein EcfA2